jgi:hypothetical protein
MQLFRENLVQFIVRVSRFFSNADITGLKWEWFSLSNKKGFKHGDRRRFHLDISALSLARRREVLVIGPNNSRWNDDITTRFIQQRPDSLLLSRFSPYTIRNMNLKEV